MPHKMKSSKEQNGENLFLPKQEFFMMMHPKLPLIEICLLNQNWRHTTLLHPFHKRLLLKSERINHPQGRPSLWMSACIKGLGVIPAWCSYSRERHNAQMPPRAGDAGYFSYSQCRGTVVRPDAEKWQSEQWRPIERRRGKSYRDITSRPLYKAIISALGILNSYTQCRDMSELITFQ